MAEFLLNWAALVHELGLPPGSVVVAAFDSATAQLCADAGLPTHSNARLVVDFSGVATGGSSLGNASSARARDGRAFQQIGTLKAQFLLDLLNQGFEARPHVRARHIKSIPSGVIPRL